MYKFLIIVFLFLFIDLAAKEDYKILSSTKSSIIVEYRPVYTNNSEITISGNKYFNIELLNGYYQSDSQVGAPEIPTRIFDIGVPSEFGNNIKVINSDYQTITGKIKPIPNVEKVNSLPSFIYKENENYYNFINHELVTFGEFGLVRDLKVQSINVTPVQFKPETQEIKIYTRIVFQVNFAPTTDLANIKKSELTTGLVINSQIAKEWGNKKVKLAKTKAVQNSVLATGDWYRFEAPEEGIYKITREFLTDLEINAGNVDPRTVKIYNNGGYYLPWTVNETRPEDLVENAIIVSGEADGSFDSNDFILFYGRGVDFWEFDNIPDDIRRKKHFYSKKNYYWLTFGGTTGKRMTSQNSSSGTPVVTQTTTRAFKFQDNDNQNLIGSGLLYVDDDYSTSSQTKTYIHTLEGLISSSEIKYAFQFVNGSTKNNSLTIDENGTRIYTRSIPGSPTLYQDYRYGQLTYGTANYSGTLADNRSALKFSFTPSTISDKGHLDYIEIEYQKNLKSKVNGIPLVFYSTPVNGLIKFETNAFNDSNFEVYNVTEFSNAQKVNVQKNGGGFDFTSSGNLDEVSKYIAIHNNDLKTPQNGEKITNQNIRGFAQGAQYIIISPKEFKEQAERLSNYRVNEAQLKTTSFIAYTNQIYNEFSGGSLDPTAIRDFIKYAYDNWEIQPEYVLLFGDGDWDYFNILGKSQNYIPSFQTQESIFELESYPFDDFYSRISGDDNKADIGIGRLNAASIEDAELLVDKIINYETKLDKGVWRSKITLLADDGLAGTTNGRIDDDGNTHTRQSENLSDDYIPKSFERNKIYLSNYQTINTGLGRRKPDCNTAIIEAINNGTLIFNYIGHGNPDVWAHEIVFDRSISIPQLRNDELFFLTAATCDFGKYDDPNVQSATEEMILKEDGGMIGGMSAVRPVFSGDNAALNNVFYSYLLGETDSLGYPVTLGSAYMKLKQLRTGGQFGNDMKFHLFGDPILRLNVPKLPVEITSVNDKSSNDTVNVKALSEVKIEGKVKDISKNDSNYEGEGIISVFDSEKIIHLDDINYNMVDQGGVIFRGRVSVENGQFSTSFTVPKDISYENKNGKIVAYFFNNEIDGVGYTDNIIVGGTDSSKTNDGKGPEIEILYDDETQSSYLVNPNFKLRVKLFDETGLNTTGTGIGHKLEAILNDDEQNAIDLTNFFIGDLNSGGKSGEVNYNFSALEPGEYKIKVNAWDVYNNFSSQENYFTVVDDNDLIIREVYNYPNPFSSNTYFTFQHNLNEPINVRIKIYTIAGRIIKEIESFNIEDKFVKIEWNGKDEDNNKIGNGTYLYKLIVETPSSDYKENILGKMAVIR
ncbi:MAG: type IX secretion system sortase PorU [Ignavibacteriales bacterium]|nr:type IX secretion system sortase PorU [Ignavibacteriales bacterium]